jgi:hypothetical protein
VLVENLLHQRPTALTMLLEVVVRWFMSMLFKGRDR